jgi:Terpene synthase family, metal binding domain.
MAVTSGRASVSLPIPPVPCPFPSEINPHVEEVERESFTWLCDSGMLPDAETVEQYRRARFGHLAARTYPRVDREMLRLVADWCMWLFAFDDGFCESARLSRHPGLVVRELPELLRVIDDLRPPEHLRSPYARALAEVKERVAAHSRPDQLDRWCTATREYMFAQVWEAANREADIVPSVEDYVFMRRRTGAMPPVIALIDIAGRFHVTREHWLHPQVRELAQLCNDLVVWDNDVFSYAKERRHDHARHNLVNVLMAHRGLTEQEALAEFLDMHNRAVARMVELDAEVRVWAPPEVRAFVRGLEHWVSGHIAYALGSSRYQQD